MIKLLRVFMRFLEEQLGLQVVSMHSRVYAVNANLVNFHAQLPYKKHTPVLVLDEVAYTDEGRLIFHTYEYHPERRINCETIRKRAG